MEKINKRLLGVEDVNWDETGRGESENFTGSDGTVKVLRKINESYIPLSNDLRELFPGSTYLNHVLVKLQEMCSSSGGGGGTSAGGGMSNDKVVNFSSSMSAAEIQIIIDEQEKNLGQHTLTFKFSENSYQLVNQSIVFDGFYNGKIIIDGNGSTVTDTGNIGSLFLFDVCVCPVEFQNFIVQMQSSSYCIEAKATLGIFVENCQMTGSEKTFFVNTILSDAEFDGNCDFSGGAQKITGYVYNWVKENYLPLKGGRVTGNLSVTGKSVVLSVNGVLANNAGDVTIAISDISGLQKALDGKAESSLYLPLAGGTMTGTITSETEDTINGSSASGRVAISGYMGLEGARLYLHGKSFPNTPGEWFIYAADGSKQQYLNAKPNGTLTWSGKNIVRSVDDVNADAAGNVALNAFPKSGGQLTGSAIARSVNNSYLHLRGGAKGSGYEAELVLYGYEFGSGTYKGGFDLRAGKGEANKYITLSGLRNGTLTWDGKDISLGYPNYAAGTATTASSYTASADGWVEVTQRIDSNYMVVTINNTIIARGGGSSYDRSSFFLPVKKGDVLKTFYSADGGDTPDSALSAKFTFYPIR